MLEIGTLPCLTSVVACWRQVVWAPSAGSARATPGQRPGGRGRAVLSRRGGGSGAGGCSGGGGGSGGSGGSERCGGTGGGGSGRVGAGGGSTAPVRRTVKKTKKSCCYIRRLSWISAKRKTIKLLIDWLICSHPELPLVYHLHKL